jgi:dienelactone hydrolase
VADAQALKTALFDRLLLRDNHTEHMSMTSYPALAPLHPAIPAADGFILRGQLVYPHGPIGTRYPLAVMAHQYPATRDSYAPLCTDLHALGIATLAFDLRGHGDSIWTTSGLRVAATPAEPTMEAFGAAFMASASSVRFSHIADDIVRCAVWGLVQNHIDPSRLLLVGSSVGGTGVLLASPRLKQGLRAVVTFGAAGAGAHSPEAMERIRINCQALSSTPMLLTSSEQDPFDGAKNIRVWSKDLKQVNSKIVPGREHAMAIYYDVRKDVLAFVKKTIAPSAPEARPVSGGRRKTR